MLSICLVDLPQYPLVRLIKRSGQRFKNSPHARRKTVPQRFQLEVYPSEPLRNMRIYQATKEDTIHSVRPLGERLDDKLSDILAPSPHLLVRINN